MITVNNFYPKFPFIHSSTLDPYRGQKFNDVIVSKKEFAMQKLQKTEQLPKKSGELLRHQEYISKFLASDTGYDELLLFHEPGTGKTCTAVAVVEGLIGGWVKGAIVCAKGEGLNKNFLQELAFTCTAEEKYLPANYDNMTDLQRTSQIRRLVNKFYSFRTFETFAKELVSLSDAELHRRYENHIFIVDEVHNLRENEDDDIAADVDLPENILTQRHKINIYSQFFRLFHKINKRKILLLSGTPIKDTPEEFASVMNLILPLSLQFNSDPKFFVRHYFEPDGRIKEETKHDIINKIKGRISYLSATIADVKKVFIGTPMFEKLTHLIVSVDVMSQFQSDVYENAYREDEKTHSIYTFSRQAALFVFPDKSVGSKGYKNYIIEKSNGKYEATRDFSLAVNTLEKLKILSSKYGFVVETILANPNSKHFIFCQYVKGSGSIVLSKILNAFGFTPANGNEQTKKLRYALCTHHTSSNSTIRRMINRFNDDDNIDGEFISIVIGSRVLNEGFTLKNVRHEYILTPHWNYSETAQAIARGWRVGSHTALINRGDKDVQVKVYQCVSVPNNNNVPSIDLEMYKTAEKKDVINKQIERLVKESAFDCPLTIDRNKITGYDGKRECDYQQCDYECDGKIIHPLDTSTYDLTESEQKKLTREIITKLQTVFNHQNEYSFSRLKKDFVNYDNFILTLVVCNLIDSYEIFTDKFGFLNFLRVANDILFLSPNPKLNEGVFNLYYSRNIILETTKSFSYFVDEIYESNIPDKITQLFNYPNMIQSLIVKLPKDVQREILYGCILAKDAGKTKNALTRDSILKFYTGFFSKQAIENIGETWVVYLYKDSLGTTCFDKEKNKFITCTNDNITIKLNISPIGWYGLYNPTLNDFCIRPAIDTTSQDLRKLTVGKRCVNYDQNVLVDLAARKMMIPCPNDYLIDVSKERMLEALKAAKFTIPNDFKKTNDRDYLKRILYWSSQRKIDLCNAMKDWFSDNNLLETNFDCGTQKKNRLKFLKEAD